MARTITNDAEAIEITVDRRLLFPFKPMVICRVVISQNDPLYIHIK
jgi:hypothetical protein